MAMRSGLDGPVRSAEDLVAELRRLRAQAGQPSFRELSRIAERRGRGEPLPPSTTSEILAGKRLPRLPRLEFVESYVAACLVAAGPGEPDERVIAAELSRWREIWCALAEPPSTEVDLPAEPVEADPPGKRRLAVVWVAVIASFLGGAGAGAAGMRWWDAGRPATAAGLLDAGEDNCVDAGEAAPPGRDVLFLPAGPGDKSWWANDPNSIGLTTDGRRFDAAIPQSVGQPGDLLVIKSGVHIVQGRPYALAFTASADRAGTVRVRVQDNKAPKFDSSYTRDLSVTPAGCRHVYRFTGSKTSDHSELTFQVGGQEAALRLRVSDVVLVESTA